MDYLPRIENMTGNREGKCTAYSKALRMLMTVKRAVPWLKSQEQGEIL